MKAKACARCRQAKLRCDSDVNAPAPCSRCSATNVACVIDTNYQRVSKTRRLMELEAEVARLRQQNHSNPRKHSSHHQDRDPPPSFRSSDTSTAPGEEPAAFDFSVPPIPNSDIPATLQTPASTSTSQNLPPYPVQPTPTSHLQPQAQSQIASGDPNPPNHSHGYFQTEQLPLQNDNPPEPPRPPVPNHLSKSPSAHYTFLSSGSTREQDLDEFKLSAAQVSQCFRTFTLQCHPWLEFALPGSPESVYTKCPLLFWVICAVSSSTNTMLKLQPGIQEMIGKVVVDPPRSVEVVQALLILCTWPFPFYSTLGDPSFVYCGIATQIGLQIGLHRPGLSHEFSKKREVLEVDNHVRSSTWMACFIVSQTQTARLGLRHSIHADFAMVNEILEAPEFSNSSLQGLCRISKLTAQFTSLVGADAQNSSGLLDPPARINMVKFFTSELENLEKTFFPKMSQILESSFLTSRLQLLSFVLHDDIPRTPDVLELFYQAEADATALILIASEKNLSRCPFHLARSVLYAALTLLKIMSSPYAQQPQVIFDQIILASRTLSTAIKVPNDHAERWSRHLQQLVAIRDLKRTPSVRSRMSASLVYDTIRVMKEHLDATSPAPLPDIPGWMNRETAAGLQDIDLDGLDWDSLGDML